ncbi:hypothetical protein [Tsukamurella soli]
MNALNAALHAYGTGRTVTVPPKLPVVPTATPGGTGAAADGRSMSEADVQELINRLTSSDTSVRAAVTDAASASAAGRAAIQADIDGAQADIVQYAPFVGTPAGQYQLIAALNNRLLAARSTLATTHANQQRTAATIRSTQYPTGTDTSPATKALYPGIFDPKTGKLITAGKAATLPTPVSHDTASSGTATAAASTPAQASGPGAHPTAGGSQIPGVLPSSLWGKTPVFSQPDKPGQVTTVLTDGSTAPRTIMFAKPVAGNALGAGGTADVPVGPISEGSTLGLDAYRFTQVRAVGVEQVASSVIAGPNGARYPAVTWQYIYQTRDIGVGGIQGIDGEKDGPWRPASFASISRLSTATGTSALGISSSFSNPTVIPGW